MSGIEGEQITDNIHTSEFNNHRAKQGLNYHGNELNGDVPNNESIHDQSIEKSKSGPDQANLNLCINDSVDKDGGHLDKTIDSGFISEKRISEDLTDKNIDYNGTQNGDILIDEGKIELENSDSTAVNKTDDELIDEQKNEAPDSDNIVKQSSDNFCENENESSIISETKDFNEVQEEENPVTDDKNIKRDSAEKKDSEKVSDLNIDKEDNKETISTVKHVTFQDSEETYESSNFNNQTDEDKELIHEQVQNTTDKKDDTKPSEDGDQDSQSDVTESFPTYTSDNVQENKVIEVHHNLPIDKHLKDSEVNLQSEESESWPSYNPENKQENTFDSEKEAKRTSYTQDSKDKEQVSQSDVSEAYKPDREQDNKALKEKEPASESEASGSWPSYETDSAKHQTEEEETSLKPNKADDHSKGEHFQLDDDDIAVEKQVAPVNTESPDKKADKAVRSDQADESFPSYEPEVTPVNACDDTLDDIEPISTVTDNPTEEITTKPTDTMENENEKSENTNTKSEVADDKARADDSPKRDTNDDTDLETTEDLRSEELVENKDIEKQESENEQIHLTNSLNDNNIPDSEKIENIDDQKDTGNISLQGAKHDDEQQMDRKNVESDGKHDNEHQKDRENLEPEIDNQTEGAKHDNEQQKDRKNLELDGDKQTKDSSQKIESEQTNEPESKADERHSPEPIPIPVVRNVNVDQTVLTLSDLEATINRLMADIKDLMGDYHTRLSAQPLSDFVLDLGKFRGDFTSVGEAYKRCESLSILLNKCLKDLRHSTDDVNILISKKFREEDLATWVDDADKMEEDKEKLREERIAVERSALAKASDARASVAQATTTVAESKLFASEAEVEAAETAALAKRAWEIAENARKTAEEAKKAAMEKRKAEEEARKRAQERAAIKAEEERKKREEENVILREEAKTKGTTFEDERKRADEEKARQEAERKNPKNWPRQIYSIEPGDFDPGIGCIIRSIDGCLKRDDVEVKRHEQMSGILTLVENEELVSNIIEIVPTDTEKKFTFEEPLAISIPHCFSRGTHGREPVVKTLQNNGKWIEVPTHDVSFEDIKRSMQLSSELKFVEMRTRRFGVFAVVSRLKRDTLTFSRKGNKVTSSVDPRITLTCRPGMFKMNVTCHIEVQPVDSTTVAELKHRKPEECGNIITTSPILRFHIANRKFSKPMMITMPLPASSHRPKRPTTAGMNREKNDQTSETKSMPARPGTAFVSSSKEEEADEEIHLLVKGHVGVWSRLQNITLVQSKNKDIVTFDIPDPYDRFLLLRMKKGASLANLDKIGPYLETSLNHKAIQLFLRQKNGAFNNIRLSCANSGRTERFIRNLAEEGYEEGPRPTKDIIVKEGQVLYVRFRGNLACLTDLSELKFVFNTHIKSGLEFNVVEQDKFAQKSFHFYRGFAKVYTTIKVSKQLPPSDTVSSSQQKPMYEIVDEELLLAELLINLPKPEPEPPQPLNTAPVKINDEGPVSDDILEFVATELGDEWKRLAQFLNLKRMRIQAILRQNNTNPDPKRIRHDMLMSWAKRLPRSVNKVEILAHALESTGRADISEVLRDKDAEFRRQRAESARNSFLRRAFVKVAQNPVAVKDWKAIAKKLGVPEDDIIEIDQTKPSIQEKCFHSLKKWQNVAGKSATLPNLSAKLKVFKHRQLAREIETIG